MWPYIWIPLASAWITLIIYYLVIRKIHVGRTRGLFIIIANFAATSAVCLFARFGDTHGVSPPQSYLLAYIEPVVLCLVIMGQHFFAVFRRNG